MLQTQKNRVYQIDCQICNKKQTDVTRQVILLHLLHAIVLHVTFLGGVGVGIC
jgi:hypothetical protein